MDFKKLYLNLNPQVQLLFGSNYIDGSYAKIKFSKIGSMADTEDKIKFVKSGDYDCRNCEYSTFFRGLEIINAKNDEIPKRFFTVVDTNNAHQMPTLFSVYGFSKFSSNAHPTKIILNFDRHPDGTKKKPRDATTEIGYQTWGEFIGTEDYVTNAFGGDVPDKYEIAYLVVGLKKDDILVEAIETKNIKVDAAVSHSRKEVGFFKVDDTKKNRIKKAKFKDFGLKKSEKRIWQAPLLEKLIQMEILEGEILKPTFTIRNSAITEEQINEIRQYITTQNYNFESLNDTAVTAAQQITDLIKKYDYPQVTAALIRDLVDERIKSISGKEDDWSTVDVFITVDRDVMKKSYTYFNDGMLTATLVREAVTNCLTLLQSKGANLVGFDITGLPMADGSSKATHNTAEILEIVKEDITTFYNAVTNYTLERDAVDESVHEVADESGDGS